MSAPSQQPPVGSATEEAARLVESLGGWFAAASSAASPGTAAHAATDASPDADTTPDPGTTADDGGREGARQAEPPGSGSSRDEPAHDPSTCRHCPLCRGIQVLRSVRPEVVGHLSAAADSLAAALRELGAPPGAGARPARPAPPQRPPPSAEPVPIRVHDDDAP